MLNLPKMYSIMKQSTNFRQIKLYIPFSFHIILNDINKYDFMCDPFDITSIDIASM